MSLAGLSLRDLEYVAAVADCRHFGRAAKQCGVSQPALSAQVQKVEAVLQVTLFERTRSGAILTPQGQLALDHIRRVLNEAGLLIAAVRCSGVPLAGPFRLGAIPTVGPYVLPHLLRPLREAYPQMQLVLSEARTAELLQDLRSGTVDAVLVCAPQNDHEFEVHRLFFEPFLMAHPPQHLPAWPPSIGGDGMVLLEEGHCLRDQTIDACRPMAPHGLRHATGLEMLRHMVAAGEGISLMPALAASALGEIEGFVTYSPVPERGVGRQVVMVVRRSDPRSRDLEMLAALARKHIPPPAEPLES